MLHKKIAARYLKAKRTLYRAMGLQQLEDALRTGELENDWDDYVSFTDNWKNLNRNHDLVVVFDGVYGAKEIQYTKEWFLKHPNIALYVLGGDKVGNPTNEEIAELATTYKDEQEWIARSPTPLPYIKKVIILNERVRSKVEELLPDTEIE